MLRARWAAYLLAGLAGHGHTVAEIAHVARFNRSAHLNRLATGGLVARRRVGSTVYYRVNDQLPRICESMRESLRARARALPGGSLP